MAKAAKKAKAAAWSEGDACKLAGTKTTGKISSIDGDVATVEWDTKGAQSQRVAVSALAKSK